MGNVKVIQTHLSWLVCFNNLQSVAIIQYDDGFHGKFKQHYILYIYMYVGFIRKPYSNNNNNKCQRGYSNVKWSYFKPKRKIKSSRVNGEPS